MTMTVIAPGDGADRQTNVSTVGLVNSSKEVQIGSQSDHISGNFAGFMSKYRTAQIDAAYRLRISSAADKPSTGSSARATSGA